MEAMLTEAYGRLKEGYFEEAVEAFSNFILLDSEEARGYYGRGMARFRLKKWEAAASDFRKAQQLRPEDPENDVALATSLAAGNKIYEAIAVFEDLLKRNPRYVRAHIQLAQLYYRLGVIAKGHRQLDVALAARPTLSERKTIEDLKNEQLALDKKRYYRPDFEELRRQNRAASAGGLLTRIKNLFGRKTGP